MWTDGHEFIPFIPRMPYYQWRFPYKLNVCVGLSAAWQCLNFPKLDLDPFGLDWTTAKANLNCLYHIKVTAKIQQ